MLIAWMIRYLDTHDKQFKDRCLQLDTDVLDSVKKAAVELAYELKSDRCRGMVRYRPLFLEKELIVDEVNLRCNSFGVVSIHDYFEDENGNELSNKRMAEVLTGSPNFIMFPAGAQQYDIDYMLTEKRPIPIDEISLSEEELEVLGYFARDLRELVSSAFFKDGAGKLSGSRLQSSILSTAVTDDEIRSFATIFRRLYMKNEPANFGKAAKIFINGTCGYPLSAWVDGVTKEYNAKLVRKPNIVPFFGKGEFPYNCKRLIDVFLYTQYAHQPEPKRSRQFGKCLNAVGGNQPLLTWLFLTELHACSLHMYNAGKIIAGFYDQYCQCHKVCPNILGSVANEHPGIGTLEKKATRKARLYWEKVEEISKTIWKERGCPEGGHACFIKQANEQLEAEVKGTSMKRKS